MGLAASQLRMLTLTARKNDLELRSQQITNNKLRLTSQSDKAAKEYTEALNAKKLVNKGGSGYSEGLSLENLQNNALNGGQQVYAYNSDNNVIVDFATYNAFENSSNVESFTNKFKNSEGKMFTQYSPSDVAQSVSGSNGVGAALTVLNDNTTDYKMTQTQYDNVNNANSALKSAKNYANNESDMGNSTKIGMIISSLDRMNKNLNQLPQNSISNAAIASSNMINSIKNKTKEDLLMTEMSKIEGKDYNDNLNKVDAYKVATGTDNTKIKSSVESHVKTICSDAISSMKTAWGKIDEKAANTALDKTKRFYADEKVYKQESDYSDDENLTGEYINDRSWKDWSNGKWFSYTTRHEYTVGIDNIVKKDDDAKAALNDGSNNRHVNLIICAQNDSNNRWVDNNAIITTFLNFYDAACAGNVETADKNKTSLHNNGGTYTTDTSVLGSKGTSNKENGTIYSTRTETADYSINLNKIKEILNKINLTPLYNEKLSNNTVISSKNKGFNDDTIEKQLKNAKKSLDSVADFYKSNNYSKQIQQYIDKCKKDDLTMTEIKAVKDLLAQVNTFAADTSNQQPNPNVVYDSTVASYYKNLYEEIQSSGAEKIDLNADADMDGVNDMKDPNYLAKLLTSGGGYLKEVKNGDLTKIDWQTQLQGYELVSDEIEIAKAKAKYEQTQNTVKGQEQILDMELKNIETEHTAIGNEEESVKGIVSKHVEKEFKLFA